MLQQTDFFIRVTEHKPTALIELFWCYILLLIMVSLHMFALSWSIVQTCFTVMTALIECYNYHINT